MHVGRVYTAMLTTGKQSAENRTGTGNGNGAWVETTQNSWLSPLPIEPGTSIGLGTYSSLILFMSRTRENWEESTTNNLIHCQSE